MKMEQLHGGLVADHMTSADAITALQNLQLNSSFSGTKIGLCLPTALLHPSVTWTTLGPGGDLPGMKK